MSVGRSNVASTTVHRHVNLMSPLGCSPVRNPGREISFPIFIKKEIETRKLERNSKQQISRLNDLLYLLNDIISRNIDIK